MENKSKLGIDGNPIRDDDGTPRYLVFPEKDTISILNGERKVTIRKYSWMYHSFCAGTTFTAIFGEGFHTKLETLWDTEIKPFNKLTDEEARAGGFNTAKEVFDTLKITHPELQKTDFAGIIRFHIP